MRPRVSPGKIHLRISHCLNSPAACAVVISVTVRSRIGDEKMLSCRKSPNPTADEEPPGIRCWRGHHQFSARGIRCLIGGIRARHGIAINRVRKSRRAEPPFGRAEGTRRSAGFTVDQKGLSFFRVIFSFSVPALGGGYAER